jgi:hypothetical protein
MAKLDPIVSEFDTDEDAEAYDKWFREQVETGLRSKGPWVTGDEVRARTQAILDKHRSA